MMRLGKLESKVENIYNGTGPNLSNGTSTITPSAPNSEKVNVAGMCGSLLSLWNIECLCACCAKVGGSLKDLFCIWICKCYQYKLRIRHLPGSSGH